MPMDAETRSEINALHHRVNEIGTRVTVVETNSIHINEKLGSIAKGVSRLMWIVVTAFVVIAAKFVAEGGLTITPPV